MLNRVQDTLRCPVPLTKMRGLMVASLAIVILAGGLVFSACATGASDRPDTEVVKTPLLGPTTVILDTDISLDVDDVGALALLHALADRKEAKIAGVVVSESLHNYDGLWGPPLVDIVNTHYGRPDIPIGVYKGPHRDIGRYGTFAETVVNAGFPHDLTDAFAAEDGVKLYRRLLSEAPDSSVTIVSIGYLTNLEGLLRSQPDEISPLTGRELIVAKVRQWSCQGGRYPESGSEQGLNFGHYPKSSQFVIENWPGRIMFVGDELGSRFQAGGSLMASLDPSDNPVALAFKAFNGGKAIETRDHLAVLYAVRGMQHQGQVYFRAVTQGRNKFEARAGSAHGLSAAKHQQTKNSWVPANMPFHRQQGYLVPGTEAPSVVSSEIDKLLMSPPVSATTLASQ